MEKVARSSGRRITVIAALAVVPIVGQGHHSRSNFIMNELVEVEGVITQHAYRNPHVYLTMQSVTENGETQEWLLEANSVSSVRNAGWGADAFAPGDRVTVTGNPDRDADKRLLFVSVITKSDGSSYRSAGIPPGAGGSPVEASQGSTDFSGVWQPDFASRDIAAGFRPVSLPMTPRGQAVLDNFSPADDPALDCVPDSLPNTILPIFPVEFTRVGEDELHMWYEEFDGRRVVHLGMREHPTDIEPSYMGHSIGWFEDGVLVIDTRHFEETVWGLGRGAPSSPQKRLVERYSLADDGMRLDVEYWFEDSEYLTERVSVQGEMFLKPGYEMEPWDCDPGAARRHLSLE